MQRVGACGVQRDVTLDHCGCLCCAFLPHLEGSALQEHKWASVLRGLGVGGEGCCLVAELAREP